jgi:excisionase family DNA binding protein
MQQAVSVKEAAAYLGVSRSKIWILIKEGALPARENPLDRRERLIPLSALETLRDQGKQPRPYPRSIGMVSDGSLQSSDIDDYLREHWRPE